MEKFYENGILKEETFTLDMNKEVNNSFYENGKIKSQKITDKLSQDWAEIRYRENGTVEFEKEFNGTQRKYYENGNLEYLKNPQKDIEQKYYENGNLKYEKKCIGNKENTKSKKYLFFENTLMNEKKYLTREFYENNSIKSIEKKIIEEHYSKSTAWKSMSTDAGYFEKEKILSRKNYSRNELLITENDINSYKNTMKFRDESLDNIPRNFKIKDQITKETELKIKDNTKEHILQEKDPWSKKKSNEKGIER
ncbi:MAG: hypothetical protein ACRDB9_08545 [Cetobacterium sp.]